MRERDKRILRKPELMEFKSRHQKDFVYVCMRVCVRERYKQEGIKEVARIGTNETYYGHRRKLCVCVCVR